MLLGRTWIPASAGTTLKRVQFTAVCRLLSAVCPPHSHSMVAGGLLLTS